MSEIEKLIELFKHCDTVKFIVSGCGEEEYKTIEFKTVIETLEKNWIRNRLETAETILRDILSGGNVAACRKEIEGFLSDTK